LIRWNHPEKGIIDPSDFIPAAEDRELIHQIGSWVLEQSCSALKNWNREFDADLSVSVNISGAQLQRDELWERIHKKVIPMGRLAANLHIEITETFLLKDEELARSILTRIKSIGPQIWLDDFGTGYSALSHLKRFNVDGVKIDKSFIVGLESNQESQALTRAMIALSKALDLQVIAEGVENKGQLQFLEEYGCTYVQGYLLDKPMPVSDFEKLLRDEKKTGNNQATVVKLQNKPDNK
jgi:EAL domain-containing protein (putative c-di-GMP-specific phosphodiesterase class I)